MQVHWSVSTVEKHLMLFPSVFVGFLYRQMVPIGPINPVLEHCHGKGVGYTPSHSVAICAICIYKPITGNMFLFNIQNIEVALEFLLY